MATTTITDLIRALETTKTMVLAVDQEDAGTGQIETKKIDLEQILNLFAVIGNEPPTGVAHIWTTDTIPTGYLELNGQSFDPNTYPQLGLIFPSGILPDWRGRVAKHTPYPLNAGLTEEDGIKAHSHVINVDNRDLGAPNTNPVGDHQHGSGLAEIVTYQDGNSSRYFLTGNPGKTEFAGGHNHYTVMGAHNHTATCSTVGATENTVKGVFVRYIVRAR